MLRSKRMWTSHSQVEPMPAWSWTERSEMKTPASEAAFFAIRAAASVSSEPRSISHAA